jgi:hypothetical protein
VSRQARQRLLAPAASALAAWLASLGCTGGASEPSLPIPVTAAGTPSGVAAEPYAGADVSHLATTHRAPVSYVWRLNGNAELMAEPQAPIALSREYWFSTTGAELGEGVPLPLSARDALVFVGEPSDVGLAATSEQWWLRSAAGVRHPLGELERLRVDSAQPSAARLPLPVRARGFALSPDVAPGDWTLEALGLPAARPLRVQVRESASAIALSLRPERAFFRCDDALHLEVTWVSPAERVLTRQLHGTATATSGQRFALGFSPAGEAWTASLAPASYEPAPGELLELEANAEGELPDGRRVLRSVRSAVSCAPSTALLVGRVEPLSDTGRLGASVGLEVGSPGRYAVTAVIYGTDASGRFAPTLALQTARWLEPGSQRLELELGLGLPRAPLPSGPLEIRLLSLQDQSRLATLERKSVRVALR